MVLHNSIFDNFYKTKTEMILERRKRENKLIWSSEQGLTVDALALTGDEGRGKLR
jgi:hypothetical protein